MYHKDSPTQREEERRGKRPVIREEERQVESISTPGGFRNHPDVPTNPNAVRERYLRKIRSLRLF